MVEGMENGRLSEKYAIARNLKEAGVSKSLIVQCIDKADKENKQDGEPDVYPVSFFTGYSFCVFPCVEQIDAKTRCHGGQSRIRISKGGGNDTDCE